MSFRTTQYAATLLSLCRNIKLSILKAILTTSKTSRIVVEKLRVGGYTAR